jgi:hypothetical protein
VKQLLYAQQRGAIREGSSKRAIFSRALREGFDTLDLKEAKALLEQLAA